MGSKLTKWRTGIDCVYIYPSPPRLVLRHWYWDIGIDIKTLRYCDIEILWHWHGDASVANKTKRWRSALQCVAVCVLQCVCCSVWDIAMPTSLPRPRDDAVCCSVLQCVAVCCSVLQCLAVCCSVLQCVAVCCSVLQCVAVCCSMLQCVAVCCSVLQCVAVCCSVLQCEALIEIAECCRGLQCVAACCSVLQRVAVSLPRQRDEPPYIRNFQKSAHYWNELHYMTV